MNEQVSKFVGNNWKWIITLIFSAGVLYATLNDIKTRTHENSNAIDRLIDLHLQ